MVGRRTACSPPRQPRPLCPCPQRGAEGGEHGPRAVPAVVRAPAGERGGRTRGAGLDDQRAAERPAQHRVGPRRPGGNHCRRIRIVEANPGKFKLPAGDLQERKVFVQRMRESVQEMKDHMVSPAAVAFMERNNREMLTGKPATLKSSSVLLDASVVSTTSCYIEEQQATQQLILDQQDQQLEMVSGSISVLKHMSGRVGEELNEQGIVLDAFAQEMDHTQSRMDGVLRKMAKISHMTSDRRQWCAIAVLLGVLLLVLVLFFSL
ncbi:syntaxin-10 isoform X3 [Ovis canadensis]|uniref:syntaxin-10 isoform X3 n=1 Tax=Ovis canadensis TaxID=37174 RepID=UPI00375093A3